MKRGLSLFCLLAASLFSTVLTAQPTNPIFRNIPPDADQVYHINLAALGSKVSWDDISGMLAAMAGGKNEEMKQYITDPSLTGIDFQQGIIVAVGHLSGNMDSPSCVTVLLQLSDSGKLMPLVRNTTKGLYKLPGKVSVIGKDKMAIAWTDKLAVFTILTVPVKPPAREGMPVISPYYTLTAAKKSAAAIEGFSNSLYTTDATFIKGFSDDADFHVWSEPGSFIYQLMELSKKKNPLPAGMKIPRPKTNMHTLTALRFDQGKISVRTTMMVPPDSAKIYSIFNSRPLNTDLITHLPGKDILGMMNLHIDPSGLAFMLDHYHTRKMLDSLLEGKGLTIDDVTRAFKGDLLLAATMPSQMPDSGKVKPDFFFVTTIGDMGAFTKLMGKMGMNKDADGNMLDKMKAGFTLRDNILVVGPKGRTEAFFTSNNADNLHLVSDLVKKNAFSIVIDFKTVAKMIQASESSSSRKTQQMLHFLSAVDRLTWAAGNYQNGQTEYYFELKMTDESENSLRSLFKLLH